MKNLIGIALIIFSIIRSAQNGEKDLTVMTFNIRYNNPDDGVNVWESRKEWVTQSIQFFEADIVGAQEVTYLQLRDMQERLPSYTSIGVGREGVDKGEFTPIFYRKDRLRFLQRKTDSSDQISCTGRAARKTLYL